MKFNEDDEDKAGDPPLHQSIGIKLPVLVAAATRRSRPLTFRLRPKGEIQ